MMANAIRGFNREAASISSLKDKHGAKVGWVFRATCGATRFFPDANWVHPYEAAYAAMEGHRHHE